MPLPYMCTNKIVLIERINEVIMEHAYAFYLNTLININ